MQLVSANAYNTLYQHAVSYPLTTPLIYHSTGKPLFIPHVSTHFLIPLLMPYHFLGTIDVLVATDVAARGLDIANVDLVLQTCPPMDHDTYVHRSGRTGHCHTFIPS